MDPYKALIMVAETKTTRRLDVLIATFGKAGLERVGRMALPHVEGVRYVVSCQNPDGRGAALPMPASIAGRDDVEMHFDAGRGLSNNRNRLLELMRAPLALIADDDIEYSREGLQAVIDTMEARPDLGLATFRYDGPHNKRYPDAPVDLSRRVKGYYVSSIEIAFRSEAVRRSGVRFNPLLGIGAPYAGCGEEICFVSDLLRAGLRGMFFPVTIACHSHRSTGERPSAAIYRGKGVTIQMQHPLTWPLRVVLEAIRARSVRSALHMAGGALYAIFRL